MSLSLLFKHRIKVRFVPINLFWWLSSLDLQLCGKDWGLYELKAISTLHRTSLSLQVTFITYLQLWVLSCFPNSLLLKTESGSSPK